LDTADLLRFLRDAHRRGYAAGQDALTVREVDHSTTIAYESGEWRFHDNYFGGEPFGGREVAFLSGRPVWMAVYYGRVGDPGAEVQPVYSFLQHALLRAPEAFPFRGPEHFTEEPFTYRNARHGDVENFWGEEIIDHRGRRVYVGWYAGGLVDLRRGD
jgi:Domain of unknown function (DUF5680)